MRLSLIVICLALGVLAQDKNYSSRHYCQDMAEAAERAKSAASRPIFGYFGDSVKNLADGYGIKREIDGSVYVGSWKVGVRNGYGKQLFMSSMGSGSEFFQGDIYQGMWKGGLPDGPGTLITVNGSKISSIWSRGKRISRSDGNWENIGEAAYLVAIEPMLNIER